MSAKTKKPTTELNVCASALRDVNIGTPIDILEALIDEGHLYLHELQASINCNPMLIGAFEYRLDHAEEVLQRKHTTLEVEAIAMSRR